MFSYKFVSAAGVDLMIAVWRKHIKNNKADLLFVIWSLSVDTMSVYCTKVSLKMQVSLFNVAMG